MKTLILYIDALGFRFINKENTPFLYKFGKENSLLRLNTLLGYTGIENTFITGKMPNETGVWTEFVYEKSFIGNFLRLIPLKNSYLSYFYALFNYLNGNTFLSKLHNIPRRFFGKFSSGVKDGLWKGDFFRSKTFVYYAWPFFVVNNKIKLDIKKRDDEYKVRKFIRSFNEEIDVYFIHLVDLDKTMHKFGTNDIETIKEMKKQDEYASLIVNEFTARFKECKIVIWSDHGFVDIKENINIQEKIKDLSIDYFLDSTIARFWTNNKEEVKRRLSEIKNGKILELKEKDKYNIPLGREFGDIIFALEPGYLILPNFYQGERGCMGMHGYMPDKADLDGFFIINKKINKKEIKLSDALSFIENGSIQF